VFKLKNVRRAPGKQGRFIKTEHKLAGITMRHYLDSNSKESPIPTSLRLHYDDETVVNGINGHGMNGHGVNGVNGHRMNGINGANGHVSSAYASEGRTEYTIAP
jgi:hypothetical protein